MNLPKLKPVQGWNFRLILCDKDFNVVFDDVAHIEMIPRLARCLVNDYKEKIHDRDRKEGEEA